MQHIIDIIFALCKIYIDGLFADFNSVPSGTIALWNSTGGTVPDGWLACNGDNGTPDLRGVFVRGAGAGFPFAGVGGSDTHTHGAGAGLESGKTRDSAASNLPPFHNLFYIMKT